MSITIRQARPEDAAAIYAMIYELAVYEKAPEEVVTTPEEMERAFRAALDAKCGCVIDCRLDMDEMVRPMVAGGSAITDFLLKEGAN